MAELPSIPGAAPPPAPLPEVMTFDDGVAFLRVSKRKVWQMVADGELPHVRVGRLIRFRRSSLTAWLAEQETGGKS